MYTNRHSVYLIYSILIADDRDFIGLDPEDNRILYIANEKDIEEEVVTISLLTYCIYLYSISGNVKLFNSL